jgi:hypothetical protein
MRPDLLLALAALAAPGPQDPAPAPAPVPAPAPEEPGGGGDEEAPETRRDEGEGALRERLRARQMGRLPAPAPLLRADGSEARPGELPPSASPEARAAWEGLARGFTEAEPMRSFSLRFYLRQRPLDRPQSNDLRLEFSFLAPGLVRARLESGRTLLRGPEGDYLLETNAEPLRLVGREGAEDRKQLDQMAAIAANFVGLTDPRTLRLAELTVGAVPAEGVHPRFRAELAKLSWLRAVSPDFYLGPEAPRPADAPPPVYRADLGVDAETGAVRFAVIHELFEGRPLRSGAMFVRMADHAERDGLSVPHTIEIHEVEPESEPWRFAASPTTQLWLQKDRGRLRARLLPEDFTP